MMDSVLDRLKRSIAQRGYWATVELCCLMLLWKILPRFRQRETQREQIDAQFDGKYNVDTGGVFRPKSHEVVGANWSFGGNYQAVDPTTFMQAMGSLQIPFQDFVFIDFGSGKGRTLLLASLFPFKRVIGVEYCPQLNEIARMNADRFRPAERRCPRIDVVDADAAEYELPKEPLLIFLYHPFAETVMSRVADNVIESYKQQPRRIVILYLLPHLAPIWQEKALFRRTREDPAVFETAPVLEQSARNVAA